MWSRCALLSALHTFLDKNVTGVLQPDELLRAEWVSRVSALDLYVHELIAQRMVEIFEGKRSPSAAYTKFQISIDTLERIRLAANLAEATQAFDLYVREHLGRITYQFPEDIADGMRLCSTVELWNEVALELGATPQNRTDEAKNIKRQLSIIVRRRNGIAHEGDLQRNVLRDPWPVHKADLVFVADQIEKIVRAIDKVA